MVKQATKLASPGDSWTELNWVLVGAESGTAMAGETSALQDEAINEFLRQLDDIRRIDDHWQAQWSNKRNFAQV